MNQENQQSRRFCLPNVFLVSGVALVILASIAPTMPLFAQYTTASLGGTVSDPSGGAVPDARLTVVNEKTGLTKVTTTQSDGSFVFPSLPVGSYRITVEKEGF